MVGIFMVAAVVFVEQAQRRIPVQYAKRMVGRRMYGGTSTYIPLKVNQAGIIPVIFASSLLYLPQLVTSLFANAENPNAVVQWISQNLATGDTPIYMATFFLLIVFFTYFYVSITFNPAEVADNMKKYGGFIPGIRPGRPTAEYLELRTHPSDRAWRALSGSDLHGPDRRAGGGRCEPELPVRRDEHSDHGWCRPGHG